tara:strand:+ start:858 stop:1151 length:294 start_codon:yes stop_codon:yes gene_type:complete
MSKKAMQKAIELVMDLDDTYEVGQVIDAIKLKQNYLASEARRNFVAGDRVKFTSRNGQTYTGTVDKIKQKYILVDVDTSRGYPMRYNVPATMLSKVA